MKLDQTHHPRSIEFQSKKINPRGYKLSDEEILCVEYDAVDDIENQCLHGAFEFSFRGIAFDWPESTPHNVIDCVKLRNSAF